MRSNSQSRRTGRVRTSVLSGSLVATVGLALLSAAPAAVADTAPLPPETTTTVSADGLPTAQVNGVVWAQVVVGNTVYATGSFTAARPAGSAAGTNETPRANLMAYNLATGALITTWAPSLNGQGLAIAASPDGSRIYVGGDFTTVNGTTRNRIAAINATTGALITTFGPGVNGRVRALAVTDDTLYVGGSFTSTGGQARGRLAAYATSNGALRAWAPVADAQVFALTIPAGLNQVVVAGSMNTINGEPNRGMGAVDATTGATRPWAVNATIQNYGPDAAIWSLTNDGTNVYGTGYGYLVNGNPATDANLEASFAATADGGTLIWANGCLGDTYGAFPSNGVLYSVGHPHDCGPIGGHPQTDPWTFQRAMATTIARGANNKVNVGGRLNGQPAPDLLHWLPSLAVGSYTGQFQAAWTITGNNQYVVLGGEFLSVNGVAQQGLVRFPVSAIAPNKQGPQGTATLTPNAVALAPGRVRVSWQSAWDRDNRSLTYEVLRGSTVGNSTVLATVNGDATWWSRPNMVFNDGTATPGSTQTYRIRVKDAFSNTVTSNPTTFTVPTGTPSSGYADGVLEDGATHYWRLGEPSGTVGYDWAGADDLTVDASATRGADGALPSDEGARSTTFSGTAAVPAVSPVATAGPNTFSAEAWFRTTSTSGGKILGFGNSNTGTSGGYDRHVYMANDGKVTFGVYPNAVRTVTSSKSYNDGEWHHVVATLGSGGMELWMDGRRVARDAGTTSGQDLTGYWRIGGDNLGGWPNQPSSSSFAGGIEDVAVYPTVLSQTQVQAHYEASGRSLNLPTRPADAYGAAVWDGNPSFYWRLDETTGTTATDRMTNSPSGTYTSGVTLGQAGGPANSAGRSAAFPGNSEQTLVSSTQVSNPTVFSLESWFKTTTTDGGRLIGFGNAQSGRSSNYDRYIYMLNDGTLRYGIWTGNATTVTTPQAYNDGQWHHVVATQGPNGIRLYVDGVQAGSDPTTTPQAYDGFWRLGTDNTWGGSNTDDFAGTMDEVAVYDSVLAPSAVDRHWQLGRPGGPVNAKPVAAFSSDVDDLTVSFDATGSSDPDGTVASYAWDFGDGETGTGATPEHDYDTAGDHEVTLTVTDDLGATDTVTRTVTTTEPANVSPVAAFTSTATNLTVAFDSAGSSDPDGTIASRTWDFGDGGTSTVVAPSHDYAAAGSYQVTLTVTDNRGGTDTEVKTVTVTAPSAVLAADTFTRTQATGLGSADTGGSWTPSSTTNTSVGNGRASLRMPTNSYGVTAFLNSVSAQGTDSTITATPDKAGTGNGVYVWVVGRRTAAGEYRGRARLLANGGVAVQVSRQVNGTETVIGTESTVPGLTYTAGTPLKLRLEVTGNGTSTLRFKVWRADGTEPADWQKTGTDTTAGIQGSGSVGVATYLSGSSTNSPVTVSFDDYSVRRV